MGARLLSHALHAHAQREGLARVLGAGQALAQLAQRNDKGLIANARAALKTAELVS